MTKRTVSILGQAWTLRYARLKTCYGDCDRVSRTIRIASGLPPQKELETVIHEMTHGADWHRDEKSVAQFAADVARVLTELGFGKVT